MVGGWRGKMVEKCLPHKPDEPTSESFLLTSACMPRHVCLHLPVHIRQDFNKGSELADTTIFLHLEAQ